MNCTRCQCTGFLNLDQVEAETLERFDKTGDHQVILDWLASHQDNDVAACDCCGDGDTWYGTPGEHYGTDDPQGPSGPYASNGGMCQCH